MATLIVLILIAIIFGVMGVVRDAKNQSRCENAYKQLRSQGFTSDQIYDELNQRGWYGSLSGRASVLEELVVETKLNSI